MACYVVNQLFFIQKGSSISCVMHAIKMPVNYSFEIENKNSIKLHSVLVHPQLRGICFRKIMK